MCGGRGDIVEAGQDVRAMHCSRGECFEAGLRGPFIATVVVLEFGD